MLYAFLCYTLFYVVRIYQECVVVLLLVIMVVVVVMMWWWW